MPAQSDLAEDQDLPSLVLSETIARRRVGRAQRREWAIRQVGGCERSAGEWLSRRPAGATASADSALAAAQSTPPPDRAGPSRLRDRQTAAGAVPPTWSDSVRPSAACRALRSPTSNRRPLVRVRRRRVRAALARRRSGCAV